MFGILLLGIAGRITGRLLRTALSAQTGVVLSLTVFAATLRLALSNLVMSKTVVTQLFLFNEIHSFGLVCDDVTLNRRMCALAEYTFLFLQLGLAYSTSMKGCSGYWETMMVFN